ncbi:MAG: Hpt domain-containing protein [Rubrivivax sp.]|jgi:HPt (histidine-containing phosphotransfer) domain-containing protein
MKPPAFPPVPPALDALAFARLVELDPSGQSGVVQRVLATFETALQRQLAEAQVALDSGNFNELGRLAHTVKSASAAVGALRLSGLCAEVEVAVRQQALDTAAQKAPLLLEEGRQALAAVRAMLRT